MNADLSRSAGPVAATSFGAGPRMLAAVLLAIWCVGMFGRGFFTPDEPREADLAWRMSWQADKSVPLLAGEPFCEKPPLTYWLAAVPIRIFGLSGWAARLPNLLYAALAALVVGLLGRRAAGPVQGLAAAAALGTFLLGYQVSIWLATDAPLLAAVAAALLGTYRGFYAAGRGERLRGYLLMHACLGLGFLAKSAVVWMVPALALIVLAAWERRWRELFRWELWIGLAVQAAIILGWVGLVQAGPDGPAHLKVFFWNNLVGRFTRVDAPADLQYAAGHRNTPGKYLIEAPMYLAPWTLLVAAAARRAWLARAGAPPAVRFALCAAVPSVLLLSFAATARNVYFAPALPGAALLLGWWCGETARAADRWDARALKGTALLLLLGALLTAAAAALAGADAWDIMGSRAAYAVIAAAGVTVCVILCLRAWRASAAAPLDAQWCLFLAYAALLVGPMSQLYLRADAWQDLGAIGRAIRADAAGHPLVLFAPDETTRAMIDLYAAANAGLVPGPPDAAGLTRLRESLRAAPDSLVVVQAPGRGEPRSAIARRLRGAGPAGLEPPWLEAAGLRVAHRYALPNGRRYLLLADSTRGAPGAAAR